MSQDTLTLRKVRGHDQMLLSLIVWHVGLVLMANFVNKLFRN